MLCRASSEPWAVCRFQTRGIVLHEEIASRRQMPLPDNDESWQNAAEWSHHRTQSHTSAVGRSKAGNVVRVKEEIVPLETCVPA